MKIEGINSFSELNIKFWIESPCFKIFLVREPVYSQRSAEIIKYLKKRFRCSPIIAINDPA